MKPLTTDHVLPVRALRAALVALTLAVCLATPLGAQSAPPAAAGKQKPRVAGEPLYYYNGKMRVELVLALDELRLESDGAPIQASSPRIVSAAPLPETRGKLHVRIRPVANRAELTSAAAELVDSSRAKSAHAILYAPQATERKASQRQILTQRLAVKVKPGQDIQQLAARYGLNVVEKVSYSPDTYILEARGKHLLKSLEAANSMVESEGVEFATPMLERVRLPRFACNDPLFPNQWHLQNTGKNAPGAVAGNDVGISSVWDSFNGTGVNVAITDDGTQMTHPDLAANCRADLGIDVIDGDNDPTPVAAADNHGTAVSGLVAALAHNGLGGIGAAFGAHLIPVRLLSSTIGATDAQEAQAMLYQAKAPIAADMASINSNSWGPEDNGYTMETFGPLTRAAFEDAIHNGRQGKGTIFTWAAGNGLQSGDNANYDGYANNRYAIAVGATGASGLQSYYSENGACLFINAPSSYDTGSITTTDRTGAYGYDATDYTSTVGGTSAACPLAAGCIALVLQANPNLSWRDVRHILVETSTQNAPSDPSWITNAAGKHFSHKFGFGRINTSAAVAAAQTWKPVPPEEAPLSAQDPMTTSLAIPDNDPTGLSRTVEISAPSNFKTEYVEVTLNATHTYRGDLAISLVSPSGTVSQLTEKHSDSNNDYNNWTFTSVVNWGENPKGVWTLRVADMALLDTGTLNSWSIKVYGYLTGPNSADNWELYR